MMKRYDSAMPEFYCYY